MKKISVLFALVLIVFESSGQSAENFLKIGNDKYESSEFQEAIKYYTKAIEIKSNFSEAYFKRGKAKMGLLKFEEGLQDYDIAIKLNPEG